MKMSTTTAPAAIILAFALSACASQPVSPVSRGSAPMVEGSDRPVILFVNGPAYRTLPQQIIGEERTDLVLDGAS